MTADLFVTFHDSGADGWFVGKLEASFQAVTLGVSLVDVLNDLDGVSISHVP